MRHSQRLSVGTVGVVKHRLVAAEYGLTREPAFGRLLLVLTHHIILKLDGAGKHSERGFNRRGPGGAFFKLVRVFHSLFARACIHRDGSVKATGLEPRSLTALPSVDGPDPILLLQNLA